MKKILVPTDFSDQSKNAALYAIELARQFHASITLFHVFTLAPATVYPPLYSPGHPGSAVIQDEVLKAEQQNKQRLEAFRDLLIKGQKEPCCHIAQRGGFVSESIQEFAQQKDFDLIVMSTHGSSSVSDLFIATNTWEVIRSGETAVMVIPETMPYTKLDHVAFATDFSDTDLESLNNIIDIAGKFDARISVVHVKPRDDDASHDQMLRQFEKKVRSIHPHADLHFTLSESENIQKGLDDFITQKNVNALAMVSRKYNIIKSLFHRKLTKQYAYHSNIPLFVFPQHKKEDPNRNRPPLWMTTRKGTKIVH